MIRERKSETCFTRRTRPFTAAVAAVLALGMAAGCAVRFREDIHSHTFSIPQMRSQECAQLVLNATSKLSGLKSVEPDVTSATLRVDYDTQRTELKNIEYAIAEAGFDVDATVARPAARSRLPEGCR